MRRALMVAALALLPAGAHAEVRSLWAIPRFFEVGRAVSLSPGAAPVDTTLWVGQGLGRGDLTALVDDAWRVFTYPEIVPGSAQPRRYALFVPRGRPFSNNGRTVLYWGRSADAFDFGVERSHTLGNLAALGPAGPTIRRLARELQPAGAGVNVQALELRYAIEDSAARLWEHKGLIPGLPVSFDRFRIEGRAAGDAPVALAIGLVPRDTPVWTRLESFSAGLFRALVATDAQGESYFLAAPLALHPSWYFGAVASDLVVDALVPALREGSAGGPASARDQPVAALFLPEVEGALVLSGRVTDRNTLAGQLEQAAIFLADHDAALADFRARGAEGFTFLRHYVQTFLGSHRSRVDPRLLTAQPYDDHFQPSNAPEPSLGVRYGGDQARALLGLVGYQRRTGDPSVVEDIWGLSEATMEARSPGGAVFRSRFDEMLIGTEEDSETGRADVFIDNGGVSVSVNHPGLVVGSGAPRVPGATWGAFSMLIGGALESVDSGDYSFAVDGDSIPETVRGDRERLAVARLFTRQDGTLRVRETATLSRGIPAARVDQEIENRGSVARSLDEVRVSIADFLQYGDGPVEARQNRYGFGAVVEGTRQPVGLWMEGMNAPLWGDSFPGGWVDLSEIYRRHRPRFLVLYGYDKAQAYLLSRAADQLFAYNAAAEQADGYRGWTTLQARYRVGRTLAPGESFRAPAVHATLMRAPLFSVDADTVPDALQALVPPWADLVLASRDHPDVASLRAALEARPDRALARLLHTTSEPDEAAIVLQAAWMAAADRLGELAARAANPQERSGLERRAGLIRENAVRAATDSLTALTELRGRPDLMPAYGIGSNYGFHLLVFDWAYRATGDPRFREALLALADEIAAPEVEGGLQVTDAGKPNFGGYVLNPRAHAQGSNNLDDQGIKLWALRVAYERTGNARYRSSAELFIDHWIKLRAEDHHFYGVSKAFDRYVETGPAQQMTPLGQQSLLIGLRAWADLHPAAARLYAAGLKNLTERHPVDAVGIAGALDGDSSGGPNVIQFGASAEVGGTFLLALTFDPAWLKGRWPARRRGSARGASTVASTDARGK